MSEWAGYPYFTKKEMSCRCGCEGLPEDSFMKKLVTIREICNFPFIISSGYRCPAYNNVVSNSGVEGAHTLGLAADIVVDGEKAIRLISVAYMHSFTGIGVSQKGDHKKRYIHVDTVPPSLEYFRPNIWSY